MRPCRIMPHRAAHLQRFIVSVCLAALPVGMHAQEVYGVLRAELSGLPAEGVVIAASRASDRFVVGRTLSGSAGTFRLGVGSDSVIVMALRIGQQPVELWRGRLALGERVDVGQSLPDVPVNIATLRVRERARCGTAVAGESSVTRALFADALTALLASLSSTDGEALVVRTATTEEFRDLRDNVQRTSAAVMRTGTTTQPFRSVPVSSLMRDGFVVTEPDGSTVYRAPDAQVLTSDAFLERYCLSLDRSRESDGLVGIRFAPQRTPREHVGVRGALWLDRSTRALRRLEFGYVGLPPSAAAASPGGTVEYAQLAGGRWIIDRWSLRMPALSSDIVTTPGGNFRAQRQRASGVQVVRGVVLEAQLRGAVLYTVGGKDAERDFTGAPDATLADAAPAGAASGRARTSTLLGDPVAALATPPEAPTCEDRSPALATVTGVVRRANGTTVAGAVVEAEWPARFQPADDRSPSWELGRATATTGDDGRFQLCSIPREVRVVLRAHTSEARSRTAQLRLPNLGAGGEVELVLQPSRFGVASSRAR